MISPTQPRDVLWEESIVLVEAGSEQDARHQAERLGLLGNHGYGSESGHVEWKFERVERIYPIDAAEVGSGTEVFSRFLRDSEVKSLLTPFDDRD
jgi:hypothetical protein